MNCPHCQKELPQNVSAKRCSFCDGNLPRKFNWFFFGLVLSAPALADFILVNFISDSMDTLGTMIFISFVGSLVSGVVCGIVLARWRNCKGYEFFFQASGFAFLTAIASFGLCCVGCTVSGIFHR
jgi:hypothetical protein